VGAAALVPRRGLDAAADLVAAAPDPDARSLVEERIRAARRILDVAVDGADARLAKGATAKRVPDELFPAADVVGVLPAGLTGDQAPGERVAAPGPPGGCRSGRMAPGVPVGQAGVLARDAAGAPRATPTMASAASRRTRRYSGYEPRRLGAGSGRTGGRSFA